AAISIAIGNIEPQLVTLDRTADLAVRFAENGEFVRAGGIVGIQKLLIDVIALKAAALIVLIDGAVPLVAAGLQNAVDRNAGVHLVRAFGSRNDVDFFEAVPVVLPLTPD